MHVTICARFTHFGSPVFCLNKRSGLPGQPGTVQSCPPNHTQTYHFMYCSIIQIDVFHNILTIFHSHFFCYSLPGVPKCILKGSYAYYYQKASAHLSLYVNQFSKQQKQRPFEDIFISMVIYHFTACHWW